VRDNQCCCSVHNGAGSRTSVDQKFDHGEPHRLSVSPRRIEPLWPVPVLHHLRRGALSDHVGPGSPPGAWGRAVVTCSHRGRCEGGGLSVEPGSGHCVRVQTVMGGLSGWRALLCTDTTWRRWQGFMAVFERRVKCWDLGCGRRK
jgi:hypothetical protein